MSYFQVLLEGENFFVEFEGKEELLGFVTTRWVKAESPEDAEFKAVELVKNDKHLINITRGAGDPELNPMIYLGEISNISWFSYFRRKPGHGYSFYPMDGAQS